MKYQVLQIRATDAEIDLFNSSEDYDAVPCEIRRWNKAGGKVLDGLIRRREAEAMLFIGNPDWHTI